MNPVSEPSAPRRIALFGGSFDPVHHGHLILARDALEQLQLDLVLFIPAAHSPHKPDTNSSPGLLRAEMIAAAIEGEQGFALCPLELSREGPSYSIDTAHALRALHPDAELFFLLGEDNLPLLHTWRRIDELRATVRFVVYGRGTTSLAHDFPRLQRRLDLSATEIRQRVARGASIRYLVPDAVQNLIHRHHLYRSTHH